MSWFDDLVSTGKNLLSGAVDLFTGNSIGSNIAKTALLGYTLNKVNKSANKQNEPRPERPDPGMRLQMPPSADYKIPVLYGTATFGGAITDAYLTPDNQTMYYCVTICEKTGNLLSTGSASTFTFNDVYLNDNHIMFQSDGITVDYMIDREGNQDLSPRGLVEIYCFAGDSQTPVVPEYYTNPSLSPAYDIMPNWTPEWMMEDLIFAIVKITYSRDKGIRGIPNMLWTMTNSMSLPGDCLYDYMTNTRYGAGIDAADITAS